MIQKKGRYSKFIRPITIVLDITIINLLSYLVLPNFAGKIWFYIFISVSWLLSSWITKYYDVYRFTKVIKIFEKIIKQYFFQFLLYSVYMIFFIRSVEPKDFITYGTVSVLLITTIKLSIFYSLKLFRKLLGGNTRKVIIIGSGNETTRLENFFNSKAEYGYKHLKTFDGNSINISDVSSFILTENVDEIYINLSLINDKSFSDIVTFADNNLKILKYIPKTRDLITDDYKLEYYGLIPIIPRRKIPLDNIYNRFIKRCFDLIFSTIVIILILSWLIPLIAMLIKIETLIKTETKGPIFFKQVRNGLNNSEFTCYKFRSMKVNKLSDVEQTSKNDNRITAIGKFIRKTSIDELPQFFNVFWGDMSVVGPRPHMVSHTKIYANKINMFMVRHLIKPGITGMAQTHGYRGEIESDRDIINRVKYDIFYLENWSMFLDLKIIYLTIYNVLKGEDKAY